MQINTIIRLSVGADVSRPSPIYRPQVVFRYPNEKVNLHQCVPTELVVRLV